MSKKPLPTGKQGKITLMVFQVEGDDSTLQESFKTITAALSGLGVARQMKTIQAPVLPTTIENGGSEEEGELETNEGNGEEDSPFTVKPAKARVLRSPDVLDIDLVKPVPSLKSFFDGKDPMEISKRYLMSIYWLKHHGGHAEVSSDHIHTCFRHMSWKTPKDAMQPLRTMKSRQQWLHKGQAPGTYTINHVGENIVSDLLK